MKLNRLLIVVVATLITLTPLVGVQAQGDGEGSTEISIALNAALNALSTDVGAAVTTTDLANWTWQEELFSDAALGCPQPGMVYAQEITRGFRITLVYNGVTYDYRVTPNGQVVVLCGSDIAAEATAVPAQPASTAVPAASAVPVENPDQLLDISLAYLNSQLGTAMTRLNLSRWTWEESFWQDTALGCPQPDGVYDDSVPVRGYSFEIEYVDRVYELHMTPDGRQIMPCGDDPLLVPVVDGLTVTGDVLQPPTAAPEIAAPTGSTLLVYTGPDGNAYLGSLTDFPGQQVTTIEALANATPAPLPRFDHILGLYRWSPDGQQIAYVDSAAPASLYVTDASGNAPVQLQATRELTPLYPPAWSPDGSEIAYITPTQTFRGTSQVMEIYAAPAPGTEPAQPRLLATFEQKVGCGGGSPDPADAVYNREAGFMGNPLTFIWSAANRLLVSPSCNGSGLIEIDLATDTTTEWLDMSITRLSFNSSNTRAVGLRMLNNNTHEIVTMDLTTGEQQSVTHTITGTPDQVAWSADEATVFVSTVDVAERLLRTSTQETIIVYTVRLWEVSLDSGETTLRLEQQGRGIGGMTPLTDGGLIFSFVEDARAWLNAVEGGADADAQRAAAPASWLLNLQPDGNVARLGYGGQPAPQPTQPVAVG